MDDDGDLTLAELLCARLCHDLAGPIGAIGTGAELLTEELTTERPAGEEDAPTEALRLLADSAAAATARLRFLRLALGPAPAFVPADQLRQVASEFLANAAGGPSHILEWRDGRTDPWTGAEAKLALNIVLLGRDCLPRGGRLLMAARQPGGPPVRLRAEGTGAAPGEGARALAAPLSGRLGARGAQGVLTTRLADRLKMFILAESVGGGIDIIAESR